MLTGIGHFFCAELEGVAGAELDQSLSGSGDQLANADAKRTLLRVKQKLEGLDGGGFHLTPVLSIRHSDSGLHEMFGRCLLRHADREWRTWCPVLQCRHQACGHVSIRTLHECAVLTVGSI